VKMPPKKGKNEEPKEKMILGRFSHNLKMGIVGLPNVGKSTFFNTLTKLNVGAENYPFCTIEPNEARVALPDERFEWLVDHWKPGSSVSAFLHVWDIAGLVKGAHEGAGLGNAFLSNIQAVDGIFHVCRAFSDEEVVHVEGDVNPVRDLEIIFDELRLKDLARLSKLVPEAQIKVTRAGNKCPKELKVELETLQKAQTMLEDDKKPLQSAPIPHGETRHISRQPIGEGLYQKKKQMARQDQGVGRRPFRRTHHPLLRVTGGQTGRHRNKRRRGRRKGIPRKGGVRQRARQNRKDRLQNSQTHLLLHRWSRRSQVLDHQKRLTRSSGRRCYPHRLRERFHQGRSHAVRRIQRSRQRSRRQGRRKV